MNKHRLSGLRPQINRAVLRVAIELLPEFLAAQFIKLTTLDGGCNGPHRIYRTIEALEHEIEITLFAHVRRVTVGTNIWTIASMCSDKLSSFSFEAHIKLFFDVCLRRFGSPFVCKYKSDRAAGFHHRGFICAKSLFADFAVNQWVAKAGEVSGRLPDLWVHNDGGIKPNDILAAVHCIAPPGVHEVPFEFNAERTVIIRTLQTAINL